jgi:hypothetical protein
VGLPEVVIPITIANKPVETRYGGLGLNFGIQSGNGSTTLCAAQSNTGALSVTGRIVRIDYVIPLAAYSMASASLTVFAPNSTGTIRPCAFGSGTTNGCILNGSFNRNSNYLLWQTAGFTTQITAFTPQAFATGPLSYWVDLQAFGVSGSVSMESIIRSVEPYIHTTLIANLPPIAYYTWIQDPGSVTLLVRDANGLSTGVETNGEIREQIPGSFYIASPTNPAVVLTNPPGGNYSVQVTGVDTGEFDLSVASVEMRTTGVQQAAVSGEILQGATLSYSLDLASPPTSMTFSGQFDGGGQRPRDVNKLLSYANIASTQTNLPTGTTSFGLQILYGSGVAPGTFKAQLNGTDISAQFHPTPGRSELVVLPLVRGRNVLELQTDGDVGGRTSSDKDRLILNAP